MIHLLVFDTGSEICERLLAELTSLGHRVWQASNRVEVAEVVERYPVAALLLTDPTCLTTLAAWSSPDLSVIPILVCSPGPPAGQKSSRRLPHTLIDWFVGPIQAELLERKIAFLTSVHSLAANLRQAQAERDELSGRIAQLHRSVEGHNSFLELMSRRDGLTGLFNRRYFNNCIRECFDEQCSRQDDLALLLLNIDYFDEINRTCGQDFGDAVLNQLSARLTSATGDRELCFRLSGEDFAVLMPSVSKTQALTKAEELRLACCEKPFESGAHSREVTVSIGVASRLAHRPKSHEELINMASQAMFKAKSEGRNRTACHTPLEPFAGSAENAQFRTLQESVKRILERTKQSTIQSLQLLVHSVLDATELEKAERAREYVQLLGERMFFPPHLIETFQNAFTLLGSIRYLLHNEMIRREGTLTASEKELLADLPYKLAEITELFDYFSGERSLLLHYGERFDGSGYPEGLKGDEIPVGARILNLISAFAAMNCDRPYRPRLTPAQIVAELCANAGRQFDPDLVLKLFDIIEEKGILTASSTDLDQARKQIRASNPSPQPHQQR